MRRSVHGAKRPRTHLISAGLMIAAAGISIVSACNSNPVEFLSSSGSIQKTLPRSASSQQKMDILWVVDNSGSMCQEQKFLGENFGKFIGGLSQTQLDFHLAVTTTHVPAGPYPLEPVAKAGHIQSTPQPIIGFDPSCRGTRADDYKPVRDALAAAVACMATPDAALNGWTTDELECALIGSRPVCGRATDLNADGVISLEDVFPQRSDYRAIPKFLKSSDYRAANGTLDVERLRADFACISLVGTRGTGYEKGLQAAILTVSPDLTGLVTEATGADATKPNHGFIRKDAGTAVIFVTDENDCSNDGSIGEPGGSGSTSACGVEACDYWASDALADSSPLLKPETFKEEFMANLALTKGVEKVEESTIIMAGIFGLWKPFEGTTFPSCSGMDKPEVPVACSDPALGKATSGDRYQRAVRQFLNYFPNDKSKGTKIDGVNDYSKRDFGWMCAGDFSPALTAIGQFIGQNPAGCIQDLVYPCETDADCPTAAYGDAAGRCLPFGEQSDTNTKKFCDTGVMITIERDPMQNASVDDINAQEYCLAGTVGVLPGKGRGTNPLSCVVDPARYEWAACPAGSGIQLKWAEPDSTVATKLAGYNIDQIFNVSIATDEP